MKSPQKRHRSRLGVSCHPNVISKLYTGRSYDVRLSLPRRSGRKRGYFKPHDTKTSDIPWRVAMHQHRDNTPGG